MIDRRTLVKGAASLTALAILPAVAPVLPLACSKEQENLAWVRAHIMEWLPKETARATQRLNVIHEMASRGAFDQFSEEDKAIVQGIVDECTELRHQMEEFNLGDYQTSDALADAWFEASSVKPYRQLKLDTSYKKHAHEYRILPQVLRYHDHKRLERLSARFEALKPANHDAI